MLSPARRSPLLAARSLVPLFKLEDKYVSSMSPTGGSCETHFSTTTSFSTDANKRNIFASLEINAKGGAAAKFTLGLSGCVRGRGAVCGAEGVVGKRLGGGTRALSTGACGRTAGELCQQQGVVRDGVAALARAGDIDLIGG